MGGHERVPAGNDPASAGAASARRPEPGSTAAGATASAPRVIALQRSAGNAAVGRLLRQVGWPGTRTTSPNHDRSTPVPGVDRYPLFDAALGGSTDTARTGATDEVSGNRVVVLVPSKLAQSAPAQVLLHFHGLNNPGYRASGRSVRDEDETRDRSEVQLAASIAEGDQQLVVVMPQGDLAAGFGDASTDPNAYIKRVLDLLKADAGVSVIPAGLVVGGWSAGGNRAAEMAVAEAKRGQPTLDAVVLFEGVNNFQTEVEADDPHQPGKRIKVRQDPLAGRDKLDIFLALVARNLKHDLGLLGVLGTDATDRYLTKSFRFLAYYGSAGLYAPVHEMLDQGIRLIFGEPLTAAEESLQRRRLSGGLQLASRVHDSAGLATAIAALPAAARDELRRHYQVIRVAQVGDEAKHKAAIAAGKLDSLGHENSVGSGALLDALRRTRPMRPVVAPPGGGGAVQTTGMPAQSSGAAVP